MIKKAGKYRGRAIEASLGEAGDKLTPYVGVRFSITEGEDIGEEVVWNGWLTEKTAECTIEALQHCGWTGDDISVFAKGLNGLNRNEVELIIEMKPYGGQNEKYIGVEFPEVRWVNKVGGRGGRFAGETMDVAKVAAYGQKFRGLAAALRAKNGSVPAPVAQTINPDDLPF